MSSEVLVAARDLGKRYLLGASGRSEPHLRQALRAALTAPFRRLAGERPPPPRELWALRHVDFDVRPGEIVGVIGRNGAGKSTLLRLLSRVTAPTEGRIGWNGRVGSLLEVGTGFHPELTGRENVYVGGALLGLSVREVDDRFDAIVAFAGVEEFLDTPVKRYSSGMRVRLGFAVAAHLDPEILLVDEVLAVGDMAFQKKCLGSLRELSRDQGRAVFFVSHDLGSVRNLCNRCLYLEAGTIAADGSPDDAIARYQASVLARYQEGSLAAFRHAAIPGDTPVHFRSLEVPSARRSGEGLPAFDHGDPLEMVLDFEVRRSYRRASLVMVLKRTTGERACYVYSADFGLLFDLEPPGGAIRIRIPALPLAPGRYTADVSITQAVWTAPSDMLLDLPLFDVETVPSTGGQMPRREWGITHLTDLAWSAEGGARMDSATPADLPPAGAPRDG